MDGFCEQVVKVNRKVKDNVLAIIYILLTLGLPALCVALAYVLVARFNSGAYMIYIGLFILIAMIPTTIVLISNQRIEYEYQVVDDFLIADKIVAKKKRKKIVKIRLDEIKSIVRFNDENSGNKKINKYFVCVDRVEDDNVFAFNFYNEARGNCALIIAPNDKMLMGMRPKLMPELQVQVLKMVRMKQTPDK